MAWPPRPLPVPPDDLHDAFVLRPPVEADAAALARAWADPQLRRWLDPPPAEEASARRWIDGEPARRKAALALDLAIVVDGVLVGEVGFSSFDEPRRACLVGYWLSSDSRGRGIASAAVSAGVAWLGTEVGDITIVAQCDPANHASHRVAERAGFALLAEDHGGLRVYAIRP